MSEEKKTTLELKTIGSDIKKVSLNFVLTNMGLKLK